ncbi:hypothetical protein [Pectobacterium versatile]|uniref:hypothetical protein n=1 Tax=Pectobacterium versatile TaxID=2488639 RepID=UPI0015DFEA51|nr:hypothetical protein [Pectobacterium versatile]MBA0171227.1 hypothetical protein [Pectobacterium versatile]MCA6917014.1 hypothetical protein [Pectobacterium versatile]
MNRLLSFSTLATQSASNHIEALPEGIRITPQNAATQGSEVLLISFDEGVARLDSDAYDHALLTGIHMIRALTDAVVLGYFQPSDRQQLILWRWFVSVKFVLEQEAANGHITVFDEQGRQTTAVLYRGKYGDIPIYPHAERSAIASTVERGLVECYGEEEGLRHALTFYVAMIDFAADGLTDIGRGVMAKLHDGAIQTIKLGGTPLTPTAH